MLEMEKIKTVLSSNMRKVRESKRISQMHLAERSGLSVQMIRDVEAGRRWPSAATIEAIAKGLEVAVWNLFEESLNIKTEEQDLSESLRKISNLLGYDIIKKS
jgi:transcriptional regulator with XRE-family HTH domain